MEVLWCPFYFWMQSVLIISRLFSKSLEIMFFNPSHSKFLYFSLKDFRSRNKTNLYRWYLSYCTGGTLLFVFVAAILDASELAPEEYLPKIGSERCFLSSELDIFGLESIIFEIYHSKVIVKDISTFSTQLCFLLSYQIWFWCW